MIEYIYENLMRTIICSIEDALMIRRGFGGMLPYYVGTIRGYHRHLFDPVSPC